VHRRWGILSNLILEEGLGASWSSESAGVLCRMVIGCMHERAKHSQQAIEYGHARPD